MCVGGRVFILSTIVKNETFFFGFLSHLFLIHLQKEKNICLTN